MSASFWLAAPYIKYRLLPPPGARIGTLSGTQEGTMKPKTIYLNPLFSRPDPDVLAVPPLGRAKWPEYVAVLPQALRQPYQRIFWHGRVCFCRSALGFYANRSRQPPYFQPLVADCGANTRRRFACPASVSLFTRAQSRFNQASPIFKLRHHVQSLFTKHR